MDIKKQVYLKISVADRNLIKELYRNGMLVEDIAKKMVIPYPLVHKYCSTLSPCRGSKYVW